MNSEKVMAALKLCADGCDDNGCSYLDESNSRGGLAACRCIDLLAIDVLALLKEQERTIERLEYDLAITQNNLNYYVNGND